ncbi:MAG: 1-(5-phosphoribosyl)-5-[(5-phosphoribosylamino)methylideneamino]imidazole-4-carboxamide isomerase [Candidatus Kaelpia imicola]|nr:1-(5-phosphoribosyl)-5-[(5-phosphoribosylamino)methylideneamino]imidazole-4-carboxamide isomerase [Candidatus Kaelpia imicola]
MLLIPAIDIRDSKVVRLRKGDFTQSRIYSDNPLNVAWNYKKAFIPRVHIVDLDAALEGNSFNKEIIKRIVSEVGLEVELGGGIRDEDTIVDYLNTGIKHLIVGTEAYRDTSWFKKMLSKYSQYLILGLDLFEQKIKITGWTETAESDTKSLVSDFIDSGLKSLIYTDISRDGTLEGIDIESLREFLDSIKGLNLNIIVSGGVSGMEDIINLSTVEDSRVEGLIVGKALYEGRISLEDLKGGFYE